MLRALLCVVLLVGCKTTADSSALKDHDYDELCEDSDYAESAHCFGLKVINELELSQTRTRP